MQVCKNKNSGKYFIYIQDTGNDEVLLVTPDADIKSLKANLFVDIEDKEEDSLLSSGHITEAQIQRFRVYEKDRSDDAVEDFEYHFDQLSPYDKKRLIEMLKKKMGNDTSGN
jgi:hypothetical protein